jgi:DNA-directed RNA polymerase subunit L
VVLQGYASEPLDEPEQFFMAASKLAEEVRAIGAEPLFFQTYAYPQGSFMYAIEPRLGGNPAQMQVRISEAYAKAAEQAKARVARVGDACQWVINNNPEINLYSYDMVHPSARGSYLMACIFISLLTDKDPCAATWIPLREITEAEAKVLRAVAKKFSEN